MQLPGAGAALRPARLPDTSSLKMVRGPGEAEAALGAAVLQLGELLFTGEVGRALELPLAGRRVAAEWRAASTRVGTRLGRRPDLEARAPRGVSACQSTS